MTTLDPRRLHLLHQLLGEMLGSHRDPHPDDWIDADSDQCPVSPRSLRDAVGRGELPGYKPDKTTLLVRRGDLDAWIEGHRVALRTKAAPGTKADPPVVDDEAAAILQGAGYSVGPGVHGNSKASRARVKAAAASRAPATSPAAHRPTSTPSKEAGSIGSESAVPGPRREVA